VQGEGSLPGRDDAGRLGPNDADRRKQGRSTAPLMIRGLDDARAAGWR
jgi:hypothetical protein